MTDPLKKVLVPAFLFFCFISFLAPDCSHAGALLYRIKQKQMMKQRQEQMAQEEYIRQQQQQSQAAGMPAPGGEQPPAPLTYQQKIDQRNQAIAQAILEEHKKTGSTDVPFGNELPKSSKKPESKALPAPSQAPSQAQAEVPAESSEVVDLAEVWKKLDKKSTIWKAIADDQAKVLTVSEYLDRYHNEGVKINQPPLHYAQMIDQMTKDSPAMLEMPFGELLKIMAIVDYDFDNGMDKDGLARKVLGDEGFEVNKKRFGQ